MELISIEIESYKSIKTPVTISFFDGLPTVLIGKNGSGKTNVLEALSAVALANTNYYGDREKGQIAYRAHIQLTEEDVVAMLSGNTHSKEQLNHYANQHNPNNSAYQANRDNRSNQCNPNNKEYDHSRGSGQKR